MMTLTPPVIQPTQTGVKVKIKFTTTHQGGCNGEIYSQVRAEVIWDTHALAAPQPYQI